MSDFLRFALAVLATWRMTHLLAREDGPFNLIATLRGRLGSGVFGGLMDCFNCLSLWVAALVALYMAGSPLEWLLGWFALSGAACLLERFGAEPIVIERLAQRSTGELDDGMLRENA